MRLATTIELNAGGKGSGPTAPCPQCGPKGGGRQPKHGYQGVKHGPEMWKPAGKAPKQETEGAVLKGPKGQPAAEPYHPKVGQPYTKKARKAEELARKTSSADMQKYLQTHPAKFPAPVKHNIEDGDKVVLAKPLKSFDARVWHEKTYPIGFEARVVEVHPFTPGHEQMVTIRIGKGTGKNILTEKVPVSDLQLLKKAPYNRPDVKVKDAPKSKTKMTTTTKDGAKYTVVKPSDAPDEDMRGKFKPHGLKGGFEDVTGQVKVLAEPMTRSQVFFAQPKGAALPQWVPGEQKGTFRQLAAAGTTVFVYRHYDTNRTVIREINTGEHGYVFRMSRTYEYKNHGAASGFLSKRYGIKQSLPKKLK